MSRATPEAAEVSFMTQPTQVIDWAIELKQLSIPTLMVHGELDPFVDLRDLEYLHSQLPDSKLVVLKGTGHLPAMARPNDVAAEINSFFAS